MTSETSSTRLTMLPVHVARTPTGVVIKRGALQTHLQGAAVAEVFAALQKCMSGTFATAEEILATFAGPQRKAIAGLLDMLRSRRIVLSEAEAGGREVDEQQESPEDVFNWHFNLNPSSAKGRARPGTVVVVGCNRLADVVVRALVRSDMEDLLVFDDVSLQVPPPRESHDGLPRSINRLDEWPAPDGVALVVACAEFGGQHLLKPWNRRAVEWSVPFLPVLQENMVGQVGPLVMPRDTPCLECVSLRENSLRENFRQSRELEELATSPRANAYHGSMLEVLGETAAFEIFRFVSGIANPLIGRLLKINLLHQRFETARLLKAPRCSVCSSLNEVALVSIEQSANAEHLWSKLAEVKA